MNIDHLVNFMIVGAQKCGTTTLTEMLRGHPSLVCCDVKEPMFFCSSKNWQDEISDYHSLYKWKEGALHFEASTSYTFFPYQENKNVWKILHAYNPNLKIIYIVRNPIDRIISGYMHAYEQGYIDDEIEKAVVENPFFLNLSQYATQIKPFLDLFGDDQVLILFFEDLIKDPTIIINQISSFLNIPSNEFGDIKNFHSNKSVGGFKIHHQFSNPGLFLRIVRRLLPSLWDYLTDNSARAFTEKPKLTRQYQEIILHFLRHEIVELEEMTGRDLSSWRQIHNTKDSINSDALLIEKTKMLGNKV